MADRVIPYWKWDNNQVCFIFVECSKCRVKLGSPTLCELCLTIRAANPNIRELYT